MKPSLGAFIDGGKPAVIDLPTLLETRMLVQANSGGGKSYVLRRLLEQTAGQVQQFVIDSEGEFSTLREKHDYVISAPHDGDALAHPRTAALLARRLLETGVSAILDIYDLKAHERKTFVRIFCETLVNAPKSLWQPCLVVIDECHVFCPEKGEAESAGAVIDLATRGRKRGFALIAATQRLAKLNKDCAAELLNKLIGRTGLDVDVKRAADELGMTAREGVQLLRPLAPGDFFVFGPALSNEVRGVNVGPVQTTHPKAGDRALRAPPKPTDAIKAVLPKLADLPKEAEAEIRSLEDAKRELANVRRELTKAQKAQSAPAAAVSSQEHRPLASTVKRLRGVIEDLMKFIVQINAHDFAAKAGAGADPAEIQKAVEAAVGRATKLIEANLDTRNRELVSLKQQSERLINRVHALLKDDQVEIAVDVKHQEPFQVAPALKPRPAARAPVSNGSGELPRGEVAVLSACIQFPEGLRREQITVLTGYKRSTRDAYIQRLREKGFVSGDGDRITATDEGCAALPDALPLPTGVALQSYWFERLPEGERAILRVLVERYPAAVARDALTDETNYKRSTRDAYLQRLSAKQLVSEASRGEVMASKDLFA